jgi:predicted mannosyl-3-phosphoglycerate phosphatase (HAD superfamily)|tara:strand:- start:83 stop:268 length:186 start_codon:yes stop_codon:yes gene_type:complete
MTKSQINIEDFLEDIDKTFNIVKNIENNKLENLDLEKLKKESDKMKDKLQKKYLDNLDTKK